MWKIMQFPNVEDQSYVLWTSFLLRALAILTQYSATLPHKGVGGTMQNIPWSACGLNTIP